MDDLWLLGEARMRRIEPFFPPSHGIARVDDRRVVLGIAYVIRSGLMWRYASKDYGPHKTIYNRLIRCGRLGVFNRIFAKLDCRRSARAAKRSHRSKEASFCGHLIRGGGLSACVPCGM